MPAIHVYSHVSPSPLSAFRGQALTRNDVDIDDIPLLQGGDDRTEEAPDSNVTVHNMENIFEAVQSPAFSVKYAPSSNRPTDVTKLKDSDVTDKPLLADDNDKEPDILDADDVPTEDERNYIPSDVVDYYNEAALKAKTRNALPDEVFGLPRTRQYPLHDKKHVMLAIKMFGHCKDPKDQKVLAANIFKAVEKFNLSPKIGKGNPLYEYAPKTLQESSAMPKLTIGGMEKPLTQRTREDVLSEHMRKNATYYNNIFYGPEFYKSMAKIPELEFLDFFYPNLTQMNFFTRLHCVCGRLGLSDEVYSQLNIRKPLATDNSDIGWATPEQFDETWFIITSEYDHRSNWFDTNITDSDHIKYCIRLYGIMGKILLDPTFDISMLDEKQFAVLTDWEQHVQYHYDLYKEATTHDEEIKEMQYLFDLFWNFNDNPQDYNVRNAMTIGFLNSMVSVNNFVPNMNEVSSNTDDYIPEPTKDGFYGAHPGSNKKVWNSLVLINNKRYRERVETLIIKGDKVLLRFIDDTNYKLPGGSSEPNSSLMQQAINECQEEVHITPKNLKYYGAYTKPYVNGSDYYGYYAHVFVGEYGEAYTKRVAAEDRDDKMLKECKWYPIKSVYKKLQSEHRNAIDLYKNNHINEANISGDIVSKEECSAYMVYELGYADDIFLLPITMEYPIIDQSSIRLAMDMVNKIPDDQLKEFTTNLNRKYKELGCKFSISVDHPYAPYADKNIISNMTHILLEGDTPVDDHGTSEDIRANQVDDPWYKRVDYTGTVGQNILDNKELGPNTKPMQKPEYTEYDSFR